MVADGSEARQGGSVFVAALEFGRLKVAIALNWFAGCSESI